MSELSKEKKGGGAKAAHGSFSITTSNFLSPIAIDCGFLPDEIHILANVTNYSYGRQYSFSKADTTIGSSSYTLQEVYGAHLENGLFYTVCGGDESGNIIRNSITSGNNLTLSLTSSGFTVSPPTTNYSYRYTFKIGMEYHWSAVKY